MICTKGSRKWDNNCDTCSTWRLIVWEDGGSEYDKGSIFDYQASTVAGKYYGGHDPCGAKNSDTFPICGDWMLGGNLIKPEN